MDKKKLEEVLDGITKKFEKAQMFQSLNDDKSAKEIINTITDEEVKIVKAVGKQLVEVSNLIMELKNEIEKENGK